MAKRDVFNEVLAGLQEIKAFEKGRKTLRTHRVTPKPLPDLSAEQIRKIREKLDVSRGVFAHQLRVSPRTLENWEQGRAKPNDQAKALSCSSPDTRIRSNGCRRYDDRHHRTIRQRR